MKKHKILRLAVFTFAIINIALLIFAASSSIPNRRNTISYEFTNVRRGTLERTVSSSGTIHPVSVVSVLPQMSGKVERIFVDFNDLVQRGDILAELNTDMLRLRREQQYAAYIRARANYELQLINHRSQEALAARNLISEHELRVSRTTLNNHAADLTVAEANLRVIETEINQHAFVTSPIDGIVLDKRINVGDTVVDSSSNNSAAMFVIAENLREMQIEASVSELDVASIQRGQPVRFTLESLPGRSFTGQVETLRLVPIVTNNVVSYTVIINVENHDGSLLPGMTSAVDFIVERRENVLIVPNAALRYQPSNLAAERNAPAQNTNTGIGNLFMGGGQNARMMGGGRQPAITTAQVRTQAAMDGNPRSPGTAQRQERSLWFLNEEGRPELKRVETGITNGTFTEILFPQDLEGRQFILRERI